jgi:hypothetical protein
METMDRIVAPLITVTLCVALCLISAVIETAQPALRLVKAPCATVYLLGDGTISVTIGARHLATPTLMQEMLGAAGYTNHK